MLTSIKIWVLMPQPEKIKEMLLAQTQEELKAPRKTSCKLYYAKYTTRYGDVSQVRISNKTKYPQKHLMTFELAN
jgi:hypothetical protein